jgi:DNA-binding NtrC family response regulator
MPIELQVKLLRVLETGSFLRIGGDQPVTVDVRVVAATNRDPQVAVSEGKLREDLLYRLQVFDLHLPPLRDRGEDIELLASHFLAQHSQQLEVPKTFSAECLAALREHLWPGNVRELKNVIHRAFILADDEVTTACLPPAIGGQHQTPRSLRFDIGSSIEHVERELILATLGSCGGNKRQAADILGVSLKTLYNRLNTYRET